MPAQYIYNANGPFAAASNVDLSARVRAYRSEASVNAEEGSVAVSTFYVDDEESGLNITGFRNFRWKESSEGSNSRIIYDGYTADRDITRGPFRVERARQWAVNTADLNSILQRRIMRGADANRPAETDVARIQWAVSTTELNLLTDTTYISTASPVAMDAADYRNQRVADIIDDCAQQSGKNYFLILNELFDPPRYGLFYDFNSSTAYGSAVRLTNVLAEVDSTTTFAVFNDDLKLNRDPSRVYPTVIVTYDGGDVYVHSDTITNNFVSRDVISPAWNVHTAAQAQARGLRYLNDIGTEEDRLVMSYLVPLASVNQLKEGHTYQVKFSHLPGYTDWTWVRALKRTTLAISEEYYKVTLEASPAAVTTVSASCSLAASRLETSDSGLAFGNTPQTLTFSTPSASPALLIAGAFITEGTGFVGPNIAVSAPWTEIRQFDPTNGHTTLMSAYKTGTVANMVLTGTSGSGGLPAYRGVMVAVPTAATSPVQSQISNGGLNIALPATPTPGNMLILFEFAENNDYPNTNPPTGFTQIYSSFSTGGTIGLNGFGMKAYYRCVETGDSATYVTGQSVSNHWPILVEVAIT